MKPIERAVSDTLLRSGERRRLSIEISFCDAAPMRPR